MRYIPIYHIKRIKDIAKDKICYLLDILGVEHDGDNSYGSLARISAPCPIHGGDNTTAWSWKCSTGYWKCFTRGCHETYKGDIFGLVRGIYARSGKQMSFVESVEWVAEKIGYKLANKEIDSEKLDIYNQTLTSNRLKQLKLINTDQSTKILRIDDVKKMIVPDTYFKKQGFSDRTIEKFNIGFCNTPNKPLYMRAFAPIIDETGEFVIGYTGRSIYPKCSKCSCYHNPEYDCPPERKRRYYPKWKHVGSTMDAVYNIDKAKNFIAESYTAIITEGPKDVWRLDEAGIHNSVAILGLQIHQKHKQLLQKNGALSLIILVDADPAGFASIERIKKEFGKSFRLYFLTDKIADGKDPGDLSTDQITKDIAPLIKEIEDVRKCQS
ncbi:MAG: toprim domain-containing protein [Balneolaceae bacterium]